MDVEKLKFLVNNMTDMFIKYHNITDSKLITKIRVSFIKWLTITGINEEDTTENLLNLWFKNWKEIKL